MRRTGIEGRAAAGVAKPRAGRGGRRRGARRRGEGRRTAVRAVALAVVAAGLVAGVGVGTFSGLGWGAVTLLCPLGALTTMLASRMLVPRAVVSLVLGVALILLVGRAFCGWVCPVPLVGRLREAFEPRRRARPAGGVGGRAGGAGAGADAAPDAGRASLPAAERRAIRRDLARARREARARELRGRLDGRHVVLAGAVASAIAFGLPAFCLVCPIGLTTAAVLLLARAFGAGDAGWTLLVVPALLVAEVVVFRRWCHALCPLGGLMSLVARGNRTLRPRVDATACVEVTRGTTCGACARACPEGIDLRHLDTSAGLHECVRCRACVEACPTKAIHIPLRAAAPRARAHG